MSRSITNQSAAASPSRDERHPHRYTAQLAQAIETRWQTRWDAEATFRMPNPGEAGFDAARPKFFCMDMFPYPSGAGLHVGHPEGYTATDIICRYKRHRGCNVLHPMGWDAFGLPAEQYAIQTGVHPAQTTRRAIDNFRRQLKRFGFSYDWSREFATIDPEYYRWTQWIWLRAYTAWYDPDQKKARPIEALLEEFSSGRREPKLNPAAAEYAGAGDAPHGTRLGDWHSLEPDIRRMVIDSYRLAYLGRQTVNWCPKLGTALANEEVIDGRSERGGYPVYRKPLRQWMFRITAFADRLLADLDQLDWPDSTLTMQREWIGRSEGAEIDFPLLDADGRPAGPSLRVFSTRPDTIFGATYMVVAPEHPLIDEAIDAPHPDIDSEVLRDYVERARQRGDVERQEAAEKSGVFTGVYARNPATGRPIPVWTSDYVLMTYGTGAIMAVPGHDQRDFEFAIKFELPIIKVVEPPDPGQARAVADDDPRTWDAPFTGQGVCINSANDRITLNDLPTPEAKARIIDWLSRNGEGMKKVNYKLRDWLFSRQRYWGEPFPIVFDEKGEAFPVAEAHLPVTLPDLADYQPIECDEPMPLLAKATGWVNTTAGEAGVDPKLLSPDTPVRRETNTMPGWAGSCWYYLRYCDPHNEARLVGREAEQYWMGGEGPSSSAGVDLYIGGAEHAVLHLLYARFWHKMLYDLGEVSTPEPFRKLYHQGLILSFAYQREDKSLVPTDEVEERREGEFVEKATGERVTQVIAKMSKSLKNVENPDEVIEQYGADTFRLYEMYLGPLDASKPWNPRDIAGLFRFLQRTWRVAVDESTGDLKLATDADESMEKHLHRMTDKVAADIERISLNTAIASMIEFVNAATSAAGDRGRALTRDQLTRFAIVLSPFAPHMAEELWHRLGHAETIAYAPWPEVDPAMLRDDAIEMPVQILGKVRGKITVPVDADAAKIEELALADEKIQAQLEGKTVRKVIVVPGKIVNIVAN